MKHIALSSINANQFICFPESVGFYNDHPAHDTLRAAGEFPYVNIHFIIKGKGYVELEGSCFIQCFNKHEGFTPFEYRQSF